MAGQTEIPVIVKEIDDKTALEIGLIENLQREDLNAVEEAKGYKTLIEEYGLSAWHYYPHIVSLRRFGIYDYGRAYRCGKGAGGK